MKKVRATLTNLKGVKKVDVNFSTKMAKVSAAKLDEKTVAVALKSAGYGVEKFTTAGKAKKYTMTVSGMT